MISKKHLTAATNVKYEGKKQPYPSNQQSNKRNRPLNIATSSYKTPNKTIDDVKEDLEAEEINFPTQVNAIIAFKASESSKPTIHNKTKPCFSLERPALVLHRLGKSLVDEIFDLGN